MDQPPRRTDPTVSVVIPARDEADDGRADRPLRARSRRARVDEVVVVDDGSTDETAPSPSPPAPGSCASEDGPGKGQAMWKGVAETSGDVIVFCDADLEGSIPRFITGLVDALTSSPGAALAKGRYAERTGTGGRVNELVARPALELLHPSLAELAQPLGGEYAAWRDVLEQVPFVHGYGVDLGLVLDVAARFGASSIVEADLGVRSHRNRSLEELRPQARVVLEVALHRAGLRAAPLAESPPLRTLPGYVRTLRLRSPCSRGGYVLDGVACRAPATGSSRT